MSRVRQVVIQIPCSRCARIDSRPFDASTGNQEHGLRFSAVLQILNGAPFKIEWEELCGPCEKTVQQHLEAIMKKIDGLSPDRKERKKKGAEAKKEDVVQDAPSPSIPIKPNRSSAVPRST